MKVLRILFISVLLFGLMTGCVSKKQYNASLDDINSLEKKEAALESNLKETVAMLEAERATRSELEMDMAGLRAEKEKLVRDNEILLEANKDINKSVAELSREKLNAVKEKDRAVAELSREKESAVTELKQTYDTLVSEMSEEIKKGEIEVTQLKDRLSLSMVDKILFDSGSAEIKKNGKTVLDRVAEILKGVRDKQIRIEGHTDNVPIGQALASRFPTNWELSTARSTTVVRYLQEQGVDPALLSVSGYSEYRPVADNDTTEGKAKNRRIEVVLIPLEADRMTSE